MTKDNNKNLTVTRTDQSVEWYNRENRCIVAENDNIITEEWHCEVRQKGCKVLLNDVHWEWQKLIVKVHVKLKVLDVGPVESVCIIQHLASRFKERLIKEFLEGKKVIVAVG